MLFQAARWTALKVHVTREARDQWRWACGLAALTIALVLALSSRDPAQGISPAVAAIALLPPLAFAAIPASVIDDTSTGFLRLVSTHPLRRGAYAWLRIMGMAVMGCAILIPLLIALVVWSGRSLPLTTTMVVVPLVALWSASGAVLMGHLVRGPAIATAAWMAIAGLNATRTFRTWSRLDLDDLFDRLAHTMPGPLVEEALTPGHDPWTWGAPTVLLLQTALMLGATVTYAAARKGNEPSTGRTRARLAAAFVAAIVLPFALPGSLEVRT